MLLRWYWVYTELRYRKVEEVALRAFVLVAIFGLLTLDYHNVKCIKWKVTVIYSLVAAAWLISQFLFSQPLIRLILDKEIRIPSLVWNNLNIAGGIFFLAGCSEHLYRFLAAVERVVQFSGFRPHRPDVSFALLSGIYDYRHMAVTSAIIIAINPTLPARVSLSGSNDNQRDDAER